jgi:hypothetical protein
MTELWAWLADGGRTMIALGVLALALCFLIVERFLAMGARLRSLKARDGRVPQVAPEVMALGGLRRMGLIRACIVIAPLLGLLGTVTGMIETFGTILQGGYVAEMSVGIRKALLTTQYGLAIAAPGLLAEQFLLQRAEKLNQLTRAAAGPAKGVA